MQSFQDHGGFTLIELLVVVAIVGVLASMVSASVSTARARAQAVRLTADFQQIAKSIEVVRTNDVLLKVTDSGCSECICRGVANINTLTAGNACFDSLYNAFVTKIGMSALPRDPWGNPYLVDENEHEAGLTDCRYDDLITAGPDHMRLTADDIGFNVPHFACIP